ncbi:MAG: S8 family serine peptidase [Mobilitalea sp.]
MQDKIKVAIIDNGLNQKLFYELTAGFIKSYQIKDGICVLDDGDTSLYGINHGTVCASLLSEFAGDAELLSISLSEQGDLPVENLETALIWCMNNRVNVICMSIGISRLVEIKRLIPLFHMLASKRITIIAAGSNNDIITYPAALPTVIGVRYKEQKGMSVIKNPIDGIDIEADMPQSRILIRLREAYNFVPPIANSIVTPYVTSKIINFIKNNKNYISLEHLKQDFGVYINADMKELKDNFSTASREELLSMLENLEIPVIGLIYDKDNHIDDMAQLSVSLHNILYCNDYNGVLLSTSLDCNMEDNIFHIDENKIESDIIRYINITSSVIVLLHLPNSILFKHPEAGFMDLIIQCEGSKFVYWEEEKSIYICENTKTYHIPAQHIFNIIEETFK